MASTKEGQQPVWGSEPVVLKDMLMKNEVPTVARVVKGQFMNIGTAKFSPLKKLHQDVLVHSIKTGLKILGHSMMRVDGRDGRTRLFALEQRLSIPSTYKGWFELLSENGRSARPLETVSDVAKLYPSVIKILVRQNVKAYQGNEVGGKMSFDTTRVVIAGEQLKIIGTFSIQLPTVEGKVMLLKCSDVKGDSLFLSFDQRGLFTPIATGDDITGVFTIKDVMSKFRLPLTVKLVQGVWPKVDSNRFSGIIRLDWAYTDETAFVSPIDRSAPRIYPIPTAVNLRLVVASNNSELRESEVFSNIMVKCNRLVSNYQNTIHLIISVPEGAVKASHAQANIFSETSSSSVPPPRPLSQTKKSRSREDILMDELDDLYGYLREGKQPPAEKFIRQRDSDEETYYEEPEFEPMSKFKSRLLMLDKGDLKGSQKNTSYNFIDPRAHLDANHNRVGTPVRISGSPPDLPPRLYKRAESVPLISYNPAIHNGPTVLPVKVGTPEGQKKPLERRLSKESMSKTSKGSGSSAEKKDSTDSKENRSSKSGSSKAMRSRKSMPLLYL